MDHFELTEEDIKSLFHTRPHQAQAPPHLPDTSTIVPSQSSLPQTVVGVGEKGSAAPPSPSPFHRPVQSVKPVAIQSAPEYMPARKRYYSKSQRLTRALILFLVSFFISFGLLNGGTYGSRLSYWWRTDVLGREPVSEQALQALVGEIPAASEPTNPSAPPPVIQTPVQESSPVAATLTKNRLIVPKIGVDAPLIWNSNPTNILTDLQRGVAHYQGTALPNSRNGNVFLTGHSSNYLWDRGQYNRVFSNLDKLVAGDFIAVTTDTDEFVYRVKESVVVRPTVTAVLDQTPTPILSLMTCTPVGTNLRRLVVKADLLKIIPLSETRAGAPL